MQELQGLAAELGTIKTLRLESVDRVSMLGVSGMFRASFVVEGEL